MTAAAREKLVCGAQEFGVALSPQQIAQFEVLAAALVKWSRKINLTAIRNEDEIVAKHFVDSLALAAVLGDAGNLLDIGSGAGFPALPMKIVQPGLQVVSVDAVEKKIFFQRHAARDLGLSGFEATHARAELLQQKYPAAFDCIVSRAFSDIPTFVRIALPLLKPSGKIIAMKGRGGMEEAEAARNFLKDLDLSVTDVKEFNLPGSDARRSIVTIEKKRKEQ